MPLVWMLLVALGLGCGGASGSGGPQVSSPFTEQHAAVFDDGLDLIEQPGSLEGRWGQQWSEDLELRLREADLIVLGNVHIVQSDVGLDQRENQRVVLAVERTFKGDLSGDQLSLVARQGAPGYPTVERHAERILNRRLVAFVKYAQEDEQVVAHFHLSPPSEAVLERLHDFEADKQPKSSVRVIHSN